MQTNPAHDTETQQDASQIMSVLGANAKKASHKLSQIPQSLINKTLSDLSSLLMKNETDILTANALDVDNAKEKSLSPALVDRLTLNHDRIKAIADSVTSIKKLESPVGNILEEWTRPNGLKIQKVTVPIGVLGMIYESRPNVTIDAAALCLKSQNAVILRGGSESFHSSRKLHEIVQTALKNNGLPAEAVSMVPSTDRALVGAMLQAHDYIDVMIPRGGQGLTGRVMAEATMPVFAHLDGNCHIYVHHSADIDLAIEVIINAKLRRTGICGAVESLLLDSHLGDDKAKKIVQALLDKSCVVIGDEKTQKHDIRVESATEEDWQTEYLEAKISCKYVVDEDDAISHINHYGSHHTDCIIATDKNAVQEFQKQVDSAIVIHNASTQFADGGEFGFGAEIGIGTGKLHARGPVGVKQLTTFKYLVNGTGQTRP